jgi:hypothetical protein
MFVDCPQSELSVKLQNNGYQVIKILRFYKFKKVKYLKYTEENKTWTERITYVIINIAEAR